MDKEKKKARKAAYYAANKDKILARSAAYRAVNKDKIAARKAAYYAANKDKLAARKAGYNAANRDKIAASNAAYRKTNKDKIAAMNAAYRVANKDKILAQEAAYRVTNKDKLAECVKKRMQNDNAFRLKHNLRIRFKKLLKTASHGGSNRFTGLIGCTTAQLKQHLEMQFKRGMTWQNYGTYWHVDHIIPCAAFDQLDMNQRKLCWHYTNLQPLKAKENLSKGKKIIKPQMSLPLCANF